MEDNKALELIRRFFWGVLTIIMKILMDIGMFFLWEPFWDIFWEGVPDVRIDYRKW